MDCAKLDGENIVIKIPVSDLSGAAYKSLDDVGCEEGDEMNYVALARACMKEYRLRIYHKHGREQITVMNGQWQDYAGCKRDQRVVEEGKPDKWLTTIQTREFVYDVAD